MCPKLLSLLLQMKDHRSAHFSLKILLQYALFEKPLHVGAATHELAIDEATWNGPRARHLAKNRLNLVAIIPLVQLNHRCLDVDLSELFLGHAAVGAVALAEDHHLVAADCVPHELRMRAIHAHVESGSLQCADHRTHGMF